MKSRIFVAALALVGLGILDAQSANAATRYFHTTGNWSVPGNWDTQSCHTAANPGIPVQGDVVIICEEKRVTVDVNAPAGGGLGQLAVRGGATILIDDHTLTIEGTDRETHDIEGLIELDVAASRLIFITNRAIIGGDGIIKMDATAAEIQLNAVTVVNQVTIEGHGVIGQGAAAGTFINEGFVHANAVDGTLDLQENTYRDGEGGVYAVLSDDGAILRFNASIADATQLASSFMVRDGATLDIDEPFVTKGAIRLIRGEVTCDSESGKTCIFGSGE